MFSIAQIIGSVISSTLGWWIKHIIIGVRKGIGDFKKDETIDDFSELFKE